MAFFSQHKMLIALIAIIVVGVGWYGLYGVPELPILSSEALPASTDPGQDVVRTLSQMHAISLSSALFSDPAFRSLKDFGTQIMTEPVGRANPFAPYGAPNSPAATSTREIKLFGPQQ